CEGYRPLGGSCGAESILSGVTGDASVRPQRGRCPAHIAGGGRLWHHCGRMKNSVEIERILAALTRAEKAELLRWVAQGLSDTYPGIETTPGVCNGAACIVRTRIPVWLLENARRLGTPEAEILRAYPQLRAEDLANAWAYVRSHRDEINDEIQ